MGGQVTGYDTLSATGVLLSALPADMGRKLPRYPLLPAVRMGRLAVAAACQGQGLCGALLADALARSRAAEIAADALAIDAKDDSALAFYRHHGLIALPGSPMTLFLPLSGMPEQSGRPEKGFAEFLSIVQDGPPEPRPPRDSTHAAMTLERLCTALDAGGIKSVILKGQRGKWHPHQKVLRDQRDGRGQALREAHRAAAYNWRLACDDRDRVAGGAVRRETI